MPKTGRTVVLKTYSATVTPTSPRPARSQTTPGGREASRLGAAPRDVELAARAGYVIVEMGEISMDAGVALSPAAERISLSDDGVGSGVF